VQSEQAISAAYYCNLAARDYTLAAGAIELVIERVPWSASIEPSQSCKLIFCARLDRLRGRKHAGDGGKFRRNLQEQSRHAMNVESVSCYGWFNRALYKRPSKYKINMMMRTVPRMPCDR
jgi:hypothetical protein